MEIEEITDIAIYDMAMDLMQSQGHYVPDLTYVVLVDGIIRAGFSDRFLPCVFVWFNTDFRQPLLIYRFIKWMGDEFGPQNGYDKLIWPISPKYETYRYAERAGLTYGGDAHWFMSNHTA